MTKLYLIYIVSPEGSVELSPVNETFRRDENVNFSCSALGGLGNTFQWVKDGLELENETSGLLTLLAIDATSGGEYTCTVSNAAGNESVSTFLFVTPEILLQPVGVNTSNGSTAVLRCGAEAFPEPEYQWERVNGTIGDSVMGTNTDTLVFDPVLFGDEGDYLCSVNSNGIRVTSDTATVTGKKEFHAGITVCNHMSVLLCYTSITPVCYISSETKST